MLFNCCQPKGVARYLTNPEQTYFGSAPSLAMIMNAYSPEIALVIVQMWLKDLMEYAGVKEKMSTQQLHSTAQVIVYDEQFRLLKTSEYLVFFHRVKAGHYGHFFGQVDPMRITEALRQFCVERTNEIEAIERIKQREERNVQAERMESIKKHYNSVKDRISTLAWYCVYGSEKAMSELQEIYDNYPHLVP